MTARETVVTTVTSRDAGEIAELEMIMRKLNHNPAELASALTVFIHVFMAMSPIVTSLRRYYLSAILFYVTFTSALSSYMLTCGESFLIF